MKKIKIMKKVALSAGLALASNNIFVGTTSANSFTEINS